MSELWSGHVALLRSVHRRVWSRAARIQLLRVRPTKNDLGQTRIDRRQKGLQQGVLSAVAVGTGEGFLDRLQLAVLNMRQSPNRNPGNKSGQFINELLIYSHPERILRKQVAVSYENVTLAH